MSPPVQETDGRLPFSALLLKVFFFSQKIQMLLACSVDGAPQEKAKFSIPVTFNLYTGGLEVG